MKHTGSRKIERLSGTIEKLLSARGMAARLREYRVIGMWDRCVGAGIARHARPATIRAGKLTVIVDSSAWMQQLSLLRPQIIGKLNSALGEEAVAGIALKLGEVERRAASAKPGPVSRRDLGAEELQRIEGYVRAIADQDLRDRLRRLIERDLRSKRPSSGPRG